MTIKVLGVGAGYFSQFHYEAWQENENVELIGIVDRDIETARSMAERFGNPPSFTDLQIALDATSPDLVDIITPPPTHLDLISQVAAAGLPAICQKPLCGNLRDAQRAADIVEQAGTKLIVHENFRFQPWYRAMADLLVNNRVGDVYQMTFRLRPGDGQGPHAYLARQPYFQTMPRFLVHETAVHFVDVFRYLMGEPSWVWADLRTLNPVITGEDAGLIVFGFEDGRRAVFDGNRLADHAAKDPRRTMGEALLEGSAATMELNGYGQLTIREHGQESMTAVEVASHPTRFGGGCVPALQAHVVEHLLHGSALENQAFDYLKSMELVEAIYRSTASGTKVSVAGS
ncbi:MAG: Gfo/Idh/MocA family oxidoreductase [Pseudomonadota bacterium]